MSTALHVLSDFRVSSGDWQKSNRRLTFRVVIGAIACWSAIGLFVWWVIR